MLDLLIAHYKEPMFFIKRLLDSIQEQYSEDINVYIANDGDEVIINKELLNNYKFNINYTVYCRSGISKIRNLLIKNSKDKYFWFIDSDDYLLENSLSQIITELKQNYDLLCCGARWEYTEGKDYDYYSGFHQYTIVGCQIFKRDWFIQNDLWSDESELIGGDIAIEILPKYYTENKKQLNFVGFYYSFNPNSLTRTFTDWAKARTKIIENIIYRLIRDNKKRNAFTEYCQAAFMLDLYKELNIDANIFKEELNKIIVSEETYRKKLEYIRNKIKLL